MSSGRGLFGRGLGQVRKTTTSGRVVRPSRSDRSNQPPRNNLNLAVEAIVDLFKTMTSRSYDPATKAWSFDLSEYWTLVEKLKAHPACSSVGELPNTVLLHVFGAVRQDGPQVEAGSAGRTSEEHQTRRRDKFTDLISEDELQQRCGLQLTKYLLPFQVEGISFAIRKCNGRCLLADDMGLGKTIQSIAVACYYRDSWPALVVCPSSVRFNWKEELCRWVDGLEADQVQVLSKTSDPCQTDECNFIITSYDLMARKIGELSQLKFQFLILDESHFIKTRTAARTKAGLALAKSAKYVMLLSGTPALSRPEELFTQISAVNPKLFPNFWSYAKRYCDAKTTPWGMVTSGCSNSAELQLILERSCLIRRTKTEVLDELPDKRRQIVFLDDSLMKLRACEKSQTLLEEANLTSEDRQKALMDFFYTTAIAKRDAVRAYLQELLLDKAAERKFLVFAHHKEMLDYLESFLIEEGIGYIRIDGRVPAASRQQRCDRFQFDDTITVAILSITAVNVGVNLTSASLVLFAELYWNPGSIVQAEDRAYRIGQKDSVSVQFLLARNTADDYIYEKRKKTKASWWELLSRKLSTLSDVGLTTDSFNVINSVSAKTSQPSILTLMNDLMDDGRPIIDDSLDDETLALLCEMDDGNIALGSDDDSKDVVPSERSANDMLVLSRLDHHPEIMSSPSEPTSPRSTSGKRSLQPPSESAGSSIDTAEDLFAGDSALSDGSNATAPARRKKIKSNLDSSSKQPSETKSETASVTRRSNCENDVARLDELNEFFDGDTGELVVGKITD